MRPRIIPCLLIHNKGLVKTTRFRDSKYIGDPINAVRIFNEKEVDELIVIDIDATVERRGPNFDLIKKIAAECRMPLCYGGGVSTASEARTLISLGVEKVAVSAAAISNPDLVTEIANEVGRQSVVVVLDAKRKLFGGYEIVTHNGKKSTGRSPVELAALLQEKGAGEVLINSVDNDGVMKGYDLNLIGLVRDVTNIPISAIGGAGSLEDISALFSRFGIVGAAAGSLFVFKGAYRAVLINYPDSLIREKLFK